MPETAHPTDVLRRFLDERGWTQGELAQALQVDPKTVSRWMTGGTNLTERKLRRVFHQLAIDPEPYGLPPLFPGPGAPVIQPAELANLEQLAAALDLIGARVSDIPAIVDRLHVMSDQLARIEARLPPVEETA